MQELTELKNLVIQSLEANGSLAKIRAQIRASVFNVVDQQEGQAKKPSPFFWENNKAQSIYELACGKDMLEVIKEFLLFYDMHYTNSIFSSESNLREDVNREAIAKKLGIDAADANKPLLYYLFKGKPAEKKSDEKQKIAQPSPKDLSRVPQHQHQEPNQNQRQQQLEKQKQEEHARKQEEQRKLDEHNKKQEEIQKKKQQQEEQQKKQQLERERQQREEQLKLEQQKQEQQRLEQQKLEKQKQEQKLQEQKIQEQQKQEKLQQEQLKQEQLKQEQLKLAKKQEDEKRLREKEFEDEKYDEYMEEQLEGEDLRDSQLNKDQFGESDEYMGQSQSQGIDMTVDSAALEEFDYYEDVEDADAD